MDNIKITQGNAFSLVLPLRARSYTSDGAFTDEDIDATLLTDIVVTFGEERVTASTTLQGVQIDLPATLARDSYDIVLTAIYNGHAIRAAYLNAVTIVKWSQQSNAEQYLLGSPITCDAAYVIALLTDSELENLKQTYAQKIAETEQAKEEYEQAKAELQGVAQETTSQEILEAVGRLGSLADSWAAMVTNRASLEGYTFANNTTVDSIGNLLCRKNLLYSVVDSTIVTISGTHTFYGCTALTSVSLPMLTSMSSYTFYGCTALTSVSLPMLTSMSSHTFYGCTALTSVSLPMLTSISGAHTFNGCTALTSVSLPLCSYMNINLTFNNCVNLIDIEIGAAMTTSFNLSTWSPINALSSSSTSLVEDGETFTSNLEKLLYNIREHIASNLPDQTGLSSLSITFSAAVKAAILADQATADAFTNKGWTIA